MKTAAEFRTETRPDDVAACAASRNAVSAASSPNHGLSWSAGPCW